MSRTFFLIALLAPLIAWAAPPGSAQPQASSPKVLRVCADPNNLPYSNRAGEGFENHLAQLIAHELGADVDYTWWPQRRSFLHDTLEHGACDVVMGLPSATTGVLTTRPYYRSTYAFVYRKHAGYDTLRSLDDPRLKKLKIGVHAIGDDYVGLPPGAVLAHRGIVRNVVMYKLYPDYRKPNPPARLIDAVAAGDVDVAIAWGPLAGYFATREPVGLAVVPLTPSHAILPFEYSISLAVRENDPALRAKLDEILQRKASAVHALLTRYGVPLLSLPHASEQAQSPSSDRRGT
jgi:quinoprotein dehydrogenase-associated probable ABC transporter substrate-binding protein